MIKNYFKIAWRNLLKNKGFTFINIAGLAVGMASAAIILFWIQDEVTFDRFFDKQDRLYLTYNRSKVEKEIWAWQTTPKIMAPTMKAAYPEVEDATRINDANYLFTVGNKHLNVHGYHADPGFFNMFSFPLVKGNPKTALSSTSGIAITEKLAVKLFGNEDPMGKIIRIDSNAHFKVTALIKDLPANTRFKFEYLMPWSYLKTIGQDDQWWGNNSVKTYVLVKPNVTEAAINAKIKNITRSHSDVKDIDVFLYPANKWHLYSKFENGVNTGGLISTVRIFAVIAAFILLIACINFMNLSTARSEKRAKEVGIRKVAGAPKQLLVAQFIGESVFISFIAGVLAIIIVQLSLSSFNELTSKELHIPYDNVAFWLISLGFILFTGLVAGSYPAFFLSSFKPVSVLKGTYKAANALVTPRKVLVVTQFTFAIILIICTIVIRKQIQHANDREVGYKSDKLVFTVFTGDVSKHYQIIRNEMMSSGAVTSVTKTSAPITQGWSDSWGFDWRGKAPGSKIDFDVFNVDGDFAKTVGVKIIAGRDIDPKSYPTDSSAIMVNESAAKAMGFKNPVGEIVKRDERTLTIVGEIKDFILGSPYEKQKPMIIQGPGWWFSVIHYRLNSAHSTEANLKTIEQIFKKYNPDYPFDYNFVDEDYSTKFKSEQRIGTLASLFAGLTIFISCLGLFGLATYMAQNRIKEVGVRKVLGASVTRITALLSRDFLALVIISFLIATPIAWYTMSEWLSSYDYRITIGIETFIAAGLITIFIALATVSFQAIRAAIANPVKSLRSE
ncbi:ABC transporter permease [Mucilaginibacter terrae]|uniref:ABC transport system permease protein n=1 Tax=Mucilaginibacter terrae TaxID=1955052 RepID=A0ABU3GSL9_9SPHI|nr:ABC transporter permease [Mucilaginibacter terrae]MDT3401660.1 putative ABC transport system permease protein [Mucilaginibacter terrae]